MKKISRRDFIKAAGAVTAAGALAACGGSSSSTAAGGSSAGGSASGEQITLRITDWSDSVNAQRLAFNEEFQANNPDIKIEYTMLTIDQFNSTVTTAIAGGEAPDLFPIPTNLNLTIACDENWFVPMEDYVSQDFVDSFLDGCLSEGVCRKNGVLYAVPECMAYTNSLIYYNKDMLAECGLSVPTNFAEFRNACKVATEKGYYGLIEGGNQVGRCETLLRALCQAAGGKISINNKALTVDGRAPYDTDEMMQAVELLQGIVADGSLHPDTPSIDAPTARELFAQGQALFLCQGLWCIGTWASQHPEFNVGVMETPKNSPKGYTSNVEWNGWMGIYKQSKHPEAAARYLEALYSTEYSYQAATVACGAYLSPIKGVNEANISNEAMKEYYAGIVNCIDIPVATTRDVGFYDFYGAVVGANPNLAQIASGILSGSVPDVKAALTTLSDAETEAWKTACDSLGLDFGHLEFPNWEAGKAYTDADYAAL